MDTRLVNLQVVLNELGVSTNIDTLDERVTFQKAIYLAQAVGVPLRYRYSWYIKGPYSKDLTRDYYALHEFPQNDAGPATQPVIKEPFASALNKLKDLMSPPTTVDLDQTDWLELLASVHYLTTTAGLNENDARDRLNGQKPSLSPYSPFATQSLKGLGLI